MWYYHDITYCTLLYCMFHPNCSIKPCFLQCDGNVIRLNCFVGYLSTCLVYHVFALLFFTLNPHLMITFLVPHFLCQFCSNPLTSSPPPSPGPPPPWPYILYVCATYITLCYNVCENSPQLTILLCVVGVKAFSPCHGILLLTILFSNWYLS